MKNKDISRLFYRLLYPRASCKKPSLWPNPQKSPEPFDEIGVAVSRPLSSGFTLTAWNNVKSFSNLTSWLNTTLDSDLGYPSIVSSPKLIYLRIQIKSRYRIPRKPKNIFLIRPDAKIHRFPWPLLNFMKNFFYTQITHHSMNKVVFSHRNTT